MMDRGELILRRCNLIERKKTSPINELGVYDFKVRKQDVERANRIIFIEDNGGLTTLKQR